MSTLFVVRHGQASFFEDNYDRLSDLGRLQSQLLGRYWAARGVHFDAVYTGPRVRQVDTAKIVGEAFRETGAPWPEPKVLPEFDEYEAEAVLKRALPGLIEEHETIRRLHDEVAATDDRAEQLRRFQRVYEVVITRWARGELALPEVESWPTFRRRVHEGLSQIVADSRGGLRVALFTSGGPIGVAVERALETSDLKTLQLAWMVRNGSFSEFLYSGDRFTLSSFNALPHLDRPELLTYR